MIKAIVLLREKRPIFIPNGQMTAAVPFDILITWGETEAVILAELEQVGIKLGPIQTEVIQ